MAKRKPVLPDQTVHHESARKKRRARSGGEMSVNLTPMIDVTFQLLIFFVVTMNFTVEGTIASKLPEQNPQGVPPPLPPITIAVHELLEDDFEVGVQAGSTERRMPLKLLLGHLQDLSQQSGYGKDTTVYLKPDPNVAYKAVLDAYSCALRAGYKEINWSGS